MIVFKNENCVISFEEKNNLMIQVWEGFSSFDNFKEAIDACIQITKKHKVLYILSDIRKQKIVTKDSTDYAVTKTPDLFKAGVKKMAFVQPESVFNQLAIKKFTADTQNNMVNNFDNYDQAKNWLLEK